MTHVPNDALREDDLPAPDSEWQQHAGFAHSFFAYDHWGSPGAVARVANRASHRFRQEGVLPGTLTELRTCLFFEHRRAVHYGGPTDEMRAYARALLQAIHQKVGAGELE